MAHKTLYKLSPSGNTLREFSEEIQKLIEEHGPDAYLFVEMCTDGWTYDTREPEYILEWEEKNETT